MSPYRFNLTRRIDPLVEPLRWVGFVCLNPSTAAEHNPDNDPKLDDPTIRRARGFTIRMGGDGFMLCNVSPFRSTDPKDLIRWARGGADVFRVIENDDAIAAMSLKCERVIVAWGANVDTWPPLSGRAGGVLVMLRRLRGGVYRIGTPTMGGHPRHPLYLPYTSPVVVHR